MKSNDKINEQKKNLKLIDKDSDNKLWFIIKDNKDVFPSKDDILDIESYGTIVQNDDYPVFAFLFRINKDNNLLYTYYIKPNDRFGMSLLEQLIFQRIYYFSFVDESNNEIRKFYYINNLKDDIKKFLRLANKSKLNKYKTNGNIEVNKDFEIQLFNKLYMKNLYQEAATQGI